MFHISLAILLIISIISVFVNSKESFAQNMQHNLLNISVPPNCPEGIKYSSNKINLPESKFSNDNLNLKGNLNAEILCFPKPNLKYDGVWTSNIENRDNKAIRNWSFK